MSSAEQTPDYIYAGWIPTVAGRLSFRHLGESRHPSPSRYANVATSKDRLIVAYQRRALSDALFPTLTNAFTKHSGDFWFVLQAKNGDGASNGDKVIGEVYIFRPEIWLSTNGAISRAVDRANNVRLSSSSNRDSEMNDICKTSRDILQGTADLTTSFELARTGEVYFSEPKFLDQKVKQASLEYAEQQKHDFLKWVADQSYFFVRDLCHQHQHHDLSEDTILVLQPRDPQDAQWREFVIYSLYFRIIRAKRSDRYPHAVRALGILAYCRSFKRISYASFRAAGLIMPRYNDAALKESLRAKIEEDSAVQQLRETEALNRATSSTNARIIALTVMLMILAFFAIFATDVASEPSNKVLRNQAAHLFRPTIELALLGLVFVWVLSSKRVLKWASVLELSNVHRRATMWAFLTISIALMVLLLTLTHSKLENVITGIIGVTQGATK